MELTEKQKQGLNIAVTSYQQQERYTVISGYAGTRKIYISKIYSFRFTKYQSRWRCYIYIFYRKSNSSTTKKGNKNVSTLHKLLFESIPKADGTFYRKPREFIPYKIVIVDECSMVPKELLQRLIKYPVYVICLRRSWSVTSY